MLENDDLMRIKVLNQFESNLKSQLERSMNMCLNISITLLKKNDLLMQSNRNYLSNKMCRILKKLWEVYIYNAKN